MNRKSIVWTGCLCATTLLAGLGCETTSKDRAARMSQGYLYYCDGAGGGGLTNWAGGLRSGLRKGGYPGAGEIFRWNTGLGVVPDQDASVDYKRGKARKMAAEAAAYTQEHPGAPVTFVGLSAGTAVVVYGMEELPPGTTVQNAVLCGASISSTYNLTRALRKLDGKMYVFTSSKDPVLGFLVPMAGTADRASGDVPSAGLHGFRMPRSTGPETRQQYAKVVTIPWRPEFAKLGYRGGHTDVLSPGFVAAHIAPRISERVGAAPTALASTKGKVRNPDFDRWQGFGVGSYVVIEGTQEYRGVRSPVRIRGILKSKSRDRVLVEREFYVSEDRATLPTQVHSLIAEAWIDPVHHPVTDPAAKISVVPGKTFNVRGRAYPGAGKTIVAGGNYPSWGANLQARAYSSDDIPGHLLELTLDSHFTGQPFKFTGQVVDFKIVPEGRSGPVALRTGQ